MKRFLCLMLALCMVFALAACNNQPSGSTTPPQGDATDAPDSDPTTAPEGDTDGDTEGEPSAGSDAFEGKIAIVTNTVAQNEEEYRSAQDVVAKYGEDKVVHVTWPDNFTTEQEQMVSIIAKLAGDTDIKALIINQAVPGTNAAVDKLLETRDDMFIIYCTPQEDPSSVVERANLILIPDELSMGPAMVEQAHAMGAKTFVHYSFPRHMAQVLLSGRRELIKEKCAELGIEFVDATAPDPTGDSGQTGAQQFILEDVPKKVAEYGADTAFFSTNCAMQVPLITSAVAEGAIYPQPCCPSPYHGYPSALGIETEEGSTMQDVIDATRAALEEADVLGRFSTWPVPAAMMNTVAGAEYAIKWMNGEVQKDGIDMSVLSQCMADYGGLPVVLSSYVETDEEGNDIEYPTFLMFIMDYLTY